MKDKLEEIFEIQKSFTDKLFKEKFNVKLVDARKDKQFLIKWSKEYILALIKEATEVLDLTDWKSHVAKAEPTINLNILEEIIDVFKYTLGLAYVYGFTESDIYNMFKSKSLVVEDKYEQSKNLEKIKKDKNQKIAFVDIDGVLADWPGGFLKYVNRETDEQYKNLYYLKKEMNKKDYLKLKEDYRLSGAKKYLNLIDNAKSFLKHLKENNYKVVLITSRPYRKYYNIYSDTLYWLKKNKLIYDAIIWDTEKEKYIIENFSEHKNIFVIDDDVDNCKKLIDSNIPTFIVLNRSLYKDEVHANKTIRSVTELFEEKKHIYNNSKTDSFEPIYCVGAIAASYIIKNILFNNE